MSITDDIRSYADTAVTQGKHYTASARDNVQDIAGKATDAVLDLRASAEKAVNLDAIKTAIEPYVSQAKEYGRSVTDRAEGLLGEKRIGKFVDTATAVSEAVVGTVQQRVVQPVRSLTGLGGKPATRKPSPVKATKQATTRPTTKPVNKPVTVKSTARKAPTKRAPKA